MAPHINFVSPAASDDAHVSVFHHIGYSFTTDTIELFASLTNKATLITCKYHCKSIERVISLKKSI